jgi:predicted metalloprotease
MEFRRSAAWRNRLLALCTVVAVAVGGVGTTTAGAATVPASGSYSAEVDRAISDIQQFWSTTLPEAYGVDYQKIPSDRLIPATQDTPIPACGGQQLTYKDVANNAFYCPSGKFVAWDDQQLFPRLDNQFGAFLLGLVLAHEWGHVVQDQTDTTGPTALLELQADCFAGAWVRHLQQDATSAIKVHPADLTSALGGYLTFRDPPGTNPTGQGAHGDAFDRVGAFQDGVTGGAQRCKDYQTNPPQITEQSFNDIIDEQSGGNLPFDQVSSAVSKDLDLYWRSLIPGYKPVSKLEPYDPNGSLPKCGSKKPDRKAYQNAVFYCPSGNFIAYDRQVMQNVYNNIGDFGVGMLIADAWATAVQAQQKTKGSAKSLALNGDCLAGSWAGSVQRGEHATPTEGLSLSPGDLDEAVRAFVAFGGRTSTAAKQVNSPFDRVEAFRKGFEQGASACNTVR